MEVYNLDRLMAQTRALAAEYRRATGKTLPVTTELAVHDAIRLLELEPAPAAAAGYDAIQRESGRRHKVLIKGRAIFDPGKRRQRIGQLNLAADWDRLVLVLLDERYEPTEIYRLERAIIEQLEARLNASRRARRGLLSVARARSIGDLCWSAERGREDDGYWENRPP